MLRFHRKSTHYSGFRVSTVGAYCPAMQISQSKLTWLFLFLRGQREMTEKYEYCSTVPGTFVQDCRLTLFVLQVYKSNSTNASVTSTYAQPPPPPPEPLRGICPPCQAGGGAFANLALPGGRAFANPRAIPELLTSTRFPLRI